MTDTRHPGKDSASLLAFAATAALVLALDLWTKAYAVAHFAGRQVPVIPHVLWFTFTLNSGAAFSMLTSATGILAAVGVAAAVGCIAFALRERSWWLRIGWGLLLGGILGNLIDRIWHGQVVDFIQVPHWPVFNVADSAITVGAVIIAVMFWRKEAGERR